MRSTLQNALRKAAALMMPTATPGIDDRITVLQAKGASGPKNAANSSPPRNKTRAPHPIFMNSSKPWPMGDIEDADQGGQLTTSNARGSSVTGPSRVAPTPLERTCAIEQIDQPGPAIHVLSRTGQAGGRVIIQRPFWDNIIAAESRIEGHVLSALGPPHDDAALAAMIGGNVPAAAPLRQIDSNIPSRRLSKVPTMREAVSQLASQLDLDVVESVSRLPSSEIDGWLFTVAGNGDLIFLEPNGRDLSETIAAARQFAVIPRSGKMSGITNWFVNGINTHRGDHVFALQDLADATGDDFIGVFNRSGGGLSDVAETALDKLSNDLRATARAVGAHSGLTLSSTPAAQTLEQIITERARERRGTRLWAHSQGTVDLALGSQRAADALAREGISDPLGTTSVVGLGGAARFWPHGYKNSYHFVHIHDATPRWLGLGQRSNSLLPDSVRAGPEAKVFRFSGSGPDFVDGEGIPILSLPKVRFASHHSVRRTYMQYWWQKFGRKSARRYNAVLLDGEASDLTSRTQQSGQTITLNPRQIRDAKRRDDYYELMLTNGTTVYTNAIVRDGRIIER